MGVVIFNGQSSLDHRIQIESPPNYQMPARDVEVVHVPGRNGDLVYDMGGFQNTNRTYKISAYDPKEDFTKLATEISGWLYSTTSYAVLEDSYEPEYFRMALYGNSLEIENLFHKAGKGTLEFYCKPQRFLKSGRKVRKFSKTSRIINPTGFDARPLITIRGNGDVVLQVGEYPVNISGLDSYLVIDSDILDCYKGLVNQNQKVKMTNGFPVLKPGESTISWTSSGIKSVEVEPRWWII